MAHIAEPMIDRGAVTPRQAVLAAAASCFGWGLDLFDLFILLYMAPTIGKLFFPAQHSMLSLAAAYASFAVTLVVRPLGSAIFGSYADQHGRRGALYLAILGVGITTALFGALPTVESIGVAAPTLFLLLRLVQGIFVGGVVASTHTIGTETVPPRWRGLLSGMIGGGGSGVGGLLASLAFMAATWLFPGPLFAVWGWRFMFFTGLITSVIGLVIFRNLEESPFWRELQKAGAVRDKKRSAGRSPLALLFSREHRPVFLVNLMMTISGGAGYYLTSGYLPTFLKLVNGLPATDESFILMTVAVTGTIGSVLVGATSEKIGRKTTFLIFGVARLILFPLLILQMAHIHDVAALAGCAVLLCFLGSGGYAPLPIFLNERFPTAVRATGTGLSWNVGFAVGGILPTFVSLFSPEPAAIPSVLVAFLVGISILYMAGAIIVPETRGNLR